MENPETHSNEPASVGVADIISTAMPEPTAPAPVATPEAAAAAPGARTPERDSLGRSFDPKKFRPELDRVGRWKNARGGRPAKAAPVAKSRKAKPAQVDAKPAAPAVSNSSPSILPPEAMKSNLGTVAQEAAAEAAAPVTAEDAQAQIQAAQAPNATAETVINAVQTVLVLIGQEEGVLTDLEKTLFRASLIRVLDKYAVGAEALPCEIDLCLTMAGIVIARLQRPKTATWFAKVRAWAVNVFWRRQGKSLASEIREATSSERAAA